MAAVPKNKRSKSKRDMKRNNFKLEALSIMECPRCHAKKVAHRVCPSCGYYNNVEIIKFEAKSKTKGSEKEAQKTKGKKDIKSDTKVKDDKDIKAEPAITK